LDGGIPDDFLFNLRDTLSCPLWFLYRKSQDEGIFPSMLKINFLSPILKAGIPSNVEIYRHIANLFHVAKMFEYLVLSSIQP